MSRFRLSLRLIGALESLEAIAALTYGLTSPPHRHGGRRGHRTTVHPATVLIVERAEWERPGVYTGDDRDAILAEERAKLASSTATLQRLAPALASLGRSEVKTSLWLSTIRKEDQGGFGLP